MYVDWLYTSHNSISRTEDKYKSRLGSVVTSGAGWNDWRECYELGNFIQDTDFKNALIDVVIEKVANDEEYNESLPHVIHSSSCKESPYRKLALGITVKTWLSKISGGHNPETVPHRVPGRPGRCFGYERPRWWCQ